MIVAEGALHAVRDDDRRGRGARGSVSASSGSVSRTSRSTWPSGRWRPTSSWCTRPASSGARPARLPLSIGDPTIVTGATAVVEHARAVRLLPPARADRRRLGWAPARSTGSATSTRRSSATTSIRRRDCPARAARARSRSTPAQVFVIMRQWKRASSRRSTSGPRPEPRRRRAGGTHPARGRLARSGADRMVTDLGIYHFDEIGEMRLIRSIRAPRSRPSATRSAGTWRSRRPRRHAGAERRRAAAHPRRARSRAASTRSRARPRAPWPTRPPAAGSGDGRSGLGEGDDELEGAWSAIETMNPPMFGAVIPKSESGKESEPATETVPLTSCALAGIWTDLVTPWRVRSPVSVTSTASRTVPRPGPRPAGSA